MFLLLPFLLPSLSYCILPAFFVPAVSPRITDRLSFLTFHHLPSRLYTYYPSILLPISRSPIVTLFVSEMETSNSHEAASLDRDIETAISIDVDDDPSAGAAAANPAAPDTASHTKNPPASADEAAAAAAAAARAPRKKVSLPRNDKKRTATASLKDGTTSSTPAAKKKRSSTGGSSTKKKEDQGDERKYQGSEFLSFPAFYPQLVQYKEEHGNLDVDRDNRPLYDFILRIRDIYRRTIKKGGLSRILTKERIAKLNELGFEFEPINDSWNWDKNYPQLVEFQRQHGHTRVNTASNSELSMFVKKLRKHYSVRDTSTMLTPEKMKLLDDIGFQWALWTKDPWEGRFMEVQDFKKAHGHCIIGPKYDSSLNDWVKNQRKAYRNFMNLLKADNDRKMAAREDPEGKVPPELDKEYERLSKKKPMIDAHRVVRLQMIDFEFCIVDLTPDEAWDRQHKALLDFKEQHGHTRVSRNYKENPKLACWVKHQRRHMTKKLAGVPGGEPLSQDRIERLDAIGFEWRLKPLVVDETTS
jgi:hypothetical protein